MGVAKWWCLSALTIGLMAAESGVRDAVAVGS